MRRAEDPFQSRTTLGQVGLLKNSHAIAIRLLPRNPRDVPHYLRESSFRRYERQVWHAGSSRDDFTPVSEVPLSPTNQPYWVLTGKPTTATVQISCFLDGSQEGIPAGLLPLPSGTARLQNLPVFSMKMNTAGSVLAQGPGLVIFDALFGPGATYDSPPGTNTRRTNSTAFQTNAPDSLVRTNGWRGNRGWGERGGGRGGGRGGIRRFVANEDLDVTPDEEEAVDAVLAELNLTKDTPYREALGRLTGFFSDKFTYSMWQGPVKSEEREETPLSRFLLRTRSGHCEYFATATVLLLRRLEIPARYATGYAVHEQSGAGYVVRFSDAHAWTLVWNESRKIWRTLTRRPLPGWKWKETASARGAGCAMGGVVSSSSWPKSATAKANARKYLLWVVAPGLVLLVYQIVFRRGRARRQNRKQDENFFANWPGLDSDFYRLEKTTCRARCDARRRRTAW